MFEDEVNVLRQDEENKPPKWIEVEEDEIILHFTPLGKGVTVESRIGSERAIARNPKLRLTDAVYEACRKVAQLVLHPPPRHWTERDSDDEPIVIPLPLNLPQPVVIPDSPVEQLDLFGNKLPF